MLIVNFNRYTCKVFIIINLIFKKNSQRRINIKNDIFHKPSFLSGIYVNYIKTFPAQMFKAAIYPYKKQNNMTIDYMPNFQ